jgi:aspartyl-tRNA(Asn)/glutamyl-tRNA(Gln) amidotransferase subunit B
MDKYKITIGLEIHVALKTTSKLFSRSACDFSSEQFSMFDAAIPGFLPVLSDKPAELAIRFALSVGADIPKFSIFERKHYFYPDSPLGYQITQQHNPIMIGGKVPITLDGKKIEVIIEHAHLECDAAKSLHDKFSGYTAIDLARGSSPLLEIVTTPCIHSPQEAKLYAQTVCELVKYLDICDGKLEEGSFRVDASISLSKTETLGTRVEIKNISSFSFLEAALEYEIERQTELLDSGESIIMETRLLNESSLTTHSMRKKESVHEYRYMPDPDIPPLVLEEGFIQKVSDSCDIYYFKRKDELQSLFDSLEIKQANVEIILLSRYKETWLRLLKDPVKDLEKFVKILAFWIPDVIAKQDETKILSFEDILFLSESTLQAKECKETISTYLSSSKTIKECVPVSMKDEDIIEIIKSVLSEYPKQVEDYKAGQEKLIQFLIGKTMAKTKGKASAVLVKDLFEKEISK